MPGTRSIVLGLGRFISLAAAGCGPAELEEAGAPPPAASMGLAIGAGEAAIDPASRIVAVYQRR
jgi:hypothetical protein